MKQTTKLQLAYEIKTYCPAASLFVLMLLSKEAIEQILDGMTLNEHAKTEKNFYEPKKQSK